MTRASKVIAALALLVLAPRAQASSPADAFGGRIPPVSGRLYSKAGSFELSPTAGISLNDAFFAKYLFGGKVGFHFSEYLGVSASVVTGFARTTGSTDVCPGNEGCRPATTAQLYQVPGYIRSIGAVELAFSPIYGKLNAFAERVIHFDMSLLAGVDWIRHRGVISAVEANAGAVPGTRSTIGGHVGLGARVFFARSMALRLEVKDLIYDVPVLNSSALQHQLLTEVGVSFFLPVRRR